MLISYNNYRFKNRVTTLDGQKLTGRFHVLKLSLLWENTNARKLLYLPMLLTNVHKRLLASPLQLRIPNTKDDEHKALQQKDHNLTRTIAGITITVTIGTLESCKAWPNIFSKSLFIGGLKKHVFVQF